jgi:YD repeat-containing protein
LSVTLCTSGGTVVRTFTHDGAGNITQDVHLGSGTYAYTMTHRNCLPAASVGGSQVGAYIYDALERLAIRTTSNVTPAGTTQFAYNPSGKVLVEANGANGVTVRECVWLMTCRWALIADVDTASPQLLHVHTEHLARPSCTRTLQIECLGGSLPAFGKIHPFTGNWKPDVTGFRNGPKCRPSSPAGCPAHESTRMLALTTSDTRRSAADVWSVRDFASRSIPIWSKRLMTILMHAQSTHRSHAQQTEALVILLGFTHRKNFYQLRNKALPHLFDSG